MASLSDVSQALFLFGGQRPWLPPAWHTSDDRVRGGSSTSSLTVLPNNCALFKGHLDIETLGGAGFASQFQSAALQQDEKDAVDKGVWNLSAYDGLEIDVGAGDGKVYTLIVKDQQPQEKRHDGRKRADINWEAELRTSETGDNGSGEGGGGKKFWVPWTALKPTYRGKEKENAGELKTDEVRRIGFMMRSYFGTQQGDFRLQLRSISARTRPPGIAETIQG